MQFWAELAATRKPCALSCCFIALAVATWTNVGEMRACWSGICPSVGGGADPGIAALAALTAWVLRALRPSFGSPSVSFAARVSPLASFMLMGLGFRGTPDEGRPESFSSPWGKPLRLPLSARSEVCFGYGNVVALGGVAEVAWRGGVRPSTMLESHSIDALIGARCCRRAVNMTSRMRAVTSSERSGLDLEPGTGR